ncbi:high choriolytic enzyme 1-like isoform X2 [Paramisgurnus dabryanus]
MTMREAKQRVQPNLSHFTIAFILKNFMEENSTAFLEALIMYLLVFISLLLSFVPAQSRSVQIFLRRIPETPDNSTEKDGVPVSTILEAKKHAVIEENAADLPVGELLHRANRGIVPEPDEPKLMDDIAVNLKNADPCTSRGCRWPKYSDGNIWVPYVIANHYSPSELQMIKRVLASFWHVSCIWFFPRTNERDYISIESRSGCYSYIGRRGNAQTVSLARHGCIYQSTIQHELLHALGFEHEQSRSDRDSYIQILWDNIKDSSKNNFEKINTLNQGTPYDYHSVMQYQRNAFSKNGYPTMVPIPNSNVQLGGATQMSKNDITRLNRLYKC